ncbi:MAG: hypothetical protein ACT4PL_04980 [Phycisphaerales bacterium]
MFELKPLSPDAVTSALAKAERYRLLNEPRDAESICRDILALEPAHQDALRCLVLALTDQFALTGEPRPGAEEVRTLAAGLAGDYDRTYALGVVAERWAKAQLGSGLPGHVLFDWFREAMALFERADAIAPQGNDDAILRYNACARLLNRVPHLRPKPEQAGRDDLMQDDVTFA